MVQDHPIASLFPLLINVSTEKGEPSGKEQFAQLVESLRGGFDPAQPIWLYEGKILDGRNRYRAAREAGVGPVTKEWVPRYGDDPVSFVLRMNLHRRHLSFEDRIRLIPAVDAIKRRAAKERHEVGVKKGGKPAHRKLAKANSAAPVRQSKHESADDTATELELSSRTVDNFRHLQLHPEICADFRVRRIGWKEARRRVKIADRENRIRVRETDNAAKPKGEAPYTLIHADIASVTEIPDGSLTAIITDPPYPKQFADCYSKLADFAAKKLAEGGNLVVMTGQANLPEFLERLKHPDLNYVWTICWITPVASTQVFGRKVRSNWKPVLWFVKGKNNNEHMRDIVTAKPTAGADNRFHKWGQDLDGFIDLIGRFTVKGDLVCDPFCGGATTGVACVSSERRFIGIDIETESIAASEKRLRAVRLREPGQAAALSVQAMAA